MFAFTSAFYPLFEIGIRFKRLTGRARPRKRRLSVARRGRQNTGWQTRHNVWFECTTSDE